MFPRPALLSGDSPCDRTLLGFRPLPIREPANEVVIRTSFIAVFERFDLELLKNLESLKYTKFYFVGQHPSQDPSITV